MLNKYPNHMRFVKSERTENRHILEKCAALSVRCGGWMVAWAAGAGLHSFQGTETTDAQFSED